MRRQIQPASEPCFDPLHAGFSLTELLVATALAASLLIALAAGSHLFAEQAEEARSTADTRFEETVHAIVADVRQGWVLERPSATRLDLTDPYGALTSYYLSAGALKVDRPSGVTGELLAGVSSASFDIDTVQRLREAPPLAVTETWWVNQATGPGLSYLYGVTEEDPPPSPGEEEREPGLLTADQSVAIGFTVSTKAPPAVSTVPGIDEEVLDVSVSGLQLPIAYAAVDPLVDIGLLGSGKTEICHIPPGHPGNAHSLNVGSIAVTAHLAHGDYVGACSTSGPTSGELNVQLYEARVPGDGRPYGPMLGQTMYSASMLPAAAYSYVGGSFISQASKWVKPPTGMLIAQPTASLPIDLSAMGVTLEPGKAYTLVLYYTGDGVVALRTDPGGDGSALRASLGQGFTSAGVEVQLSLSGRRLFTQTMAHDVISRVSLAVGLDDGRSLTASAAVDGQVAAISPWHGVVPGELPALETHGQ